MDSAFRLLNARSCMDRLLLVVALLAFGSQAAASQQQIPANAHKSMFGTGWECNRGFARSGDQCVAVQIPQNAELDVFGHGWQCRRGYVQTSDACVPVRIPANAHLDLFGHGWECDSNYKRQDSGCIAMSAEEAKAAQQRQRELIQKFATQRRALDSLDWSGCNSELDRLRRSARDASDQASAVESAKSSYDSCRRDRSNDCSNEQSHYESERSNFVSELDTVMSRYKGALSSCGQ
jgi:hypothetical protein